MFNIFLRRRNSKAAQEIDSIIRSIDKVLLSLPPRKDSYESYVKFLFQLYSHSDYTVDKTASILLKSRRMVVYYRAMAYEHGIIKEYQGHYSGFQRPITAIDGLPKSLQQEARKAVLGYLKQRQTREQFLEFKKRTQENRARLREERKNKDKDDGDNASLDSTLPLSNGKPFFKDSSTTNKKFIESEKVKNLSFSRLAIPWFAKKFNIDRKITEKIIISDFKQVEYEIIHLGRKYNSPIAVLISRIKRSLTLAKAILAKGQTFFTREERKAYQPKPQRKALSEVERFKRTLKEQQERQEKYHQIEQECNLDHDWNMIINNLKEAT